MGDTDKAQYLGMTTAMHQQLPEIEYLMCFYHVIKKVSLKLIEYDSPMPDIIAYDSPCIECYEMRTELTKEEWRDVSFDIYLLHMSVRRVDLVMEVVYDKWVTSRGLRNFRR
ncbi:hypothetical protein B5M09_011702 [Aphanomyces astaci]|uniref:MULE transposase domain-containing protein n=1 Tax=Aphanomyces astaci TaxID=112090 RepID=A0A425DIW7_APHAT|nr:hypothetical protein B5M09_011702 [Aphanomyces astaci]